MQIMSAQIQRDLLISVYGDYINHPSEMHTNSSSMQAMHKNLIPSFWIVFSVSVSRCESGRDYMHVTTYHPILE